MLRSITNWILGSGSTPNQAFDRNSLLGFSQAVVDKLIRDTNSLSQGPGILRIKGSLRSSLESLKRHLEEISTNPHSQQSGQEQILVVLGCLERICEWPSPYEEIRGAFTPEQYPRLKLLLQPLSTAHSDIARFAAARAIKNAGAQRLWEALHDSFENLEGPWDVELRDEPKGPGLSELHKSTAGKDDPDDNQSYMLHLYNALSEHFNSPRCRFTRESIIVNLRLNWWFKEEFGDGIVLWFALFFLINQCHAPEPSHAAVYQWQDIHVSVPKLKKVIIQEPSLAKGVDIAEALAASSIDESRETDGLSSSSSNVEDDDEFCCHLQDTFRGQLKFTYSTDFKLQKAEQPKRPFLQTTSSVPLSRLIGTGKLNLQMKSFLSVDLVRTLWQYYQSEWIQDDWGKDSVHFMFDKKTGESNIVSMHEPFLHTQFETTSHVVTTESSTGRANERLSKQRRRLQQKARTHRYPKLLALGIVLLEIQLDKDLQEFGTPGCSDPDVVNIRHSIAATILGNSEIWPPKGIYRPIKEAIEICITADMKVLSNDERSMRRNFFDKVVRPLETFLTGAWEPSEKMNTIEIEEKIIKSWKKSTNQHKEHHIEDVGQEAEDSAEDHTRVVDNLSTGKIGGTMSGDSSYTAKNWFLDLANLTYILDIKDHQGDGPGHEAKPVKVAILDTGVDEKYYRNDQDERKAIKAYKDFVSNHPTPQDGTGHGTFCIRLLQKVYQGAEIFVGRVFRRKEADDTTKQLMAKAIDYAVNDWKVEVICLPSGFLSTRMSKDEHNAISTAISHAREKKVLVVAAASNLGNTAAIVFPAELYQSFELFCMFSTTALVKPTCSFNPSALADAKYNFAILGEGIEFPPDTKLHRGTSFSTIIAAGIAAQIIDFARHPKVHAQVPEHERLREVFGMSAVFARMVSAKDNGYHCLRPWKLLGGMTVQRNSEEEIREKVCRIISDALENMY